MANTCVPNKNLFIFKTIAILFLSSLTLSNAASIESQETTVATITTTSSTTTTTTTTETPSTTASSASPDVNFEGVRCLIYMGKQLDENPTHPYTSLDELETAFNDVIPIKNCAQIIGKMRLEAFGPEQREPIQELMDFVNRHIQFGQKIKA